MEKPYINLQKHMKHMKHFTLKSNSAFHDEPTIFLTYDFFLLDVLISTTMCVHTHTHTLKHTCMQTLEQYAHAHTHTIYSLMC